MRKFLKNNLADVGTIGAAVAILVTIMVSGLTVTVLMSGRMTCGVQKEPTILVAYITLL